MSEFTTLQQKAMRLHAQRRQVHPLSHERSEIDRALFGIYQAQWGEA